MVILPNLHETVRKVNTVILFFISMSLRLVFAETDSITYSLSSPLLIADVQNVQNVMKRAQKLVFVCINRHHGVSHGPLSI